MSRLSNNLLILRSKHQQVNVFLKEEKLCFAN